MKKILILMLVALLFVPLVSAADWDNKLYYSKDEMKVNFSNTFLLLFKTSDIGTIELKSHTFVDEVKQVNEGSEVVMWYDFDFLGLYENGLGDVEFTDMKTREEVDRNYKYVYWGDKNYEIPTFSDVMLKNGTIISKEIGTETIQRQGWVDYNSRDIPKGNIRIGIQVEVRNGDYMDGIWEIAGKKVKKHATWTDQPLNTNLISYYKLDETSGINAEDSNGFFNGTANDTDVFGTSQPGIINTGSDHRVGDFIDIGKTATEMGMVSALTVSLWADVRTRETGNHELISDLNPDGVLIRYRNTDDLLVAVADAADFDSDAIDNVITVAGIYHIVITWSATTNNLSTYVNGTHVGSVGTSIANIGLSDSDVLFGQKFDNTNFFNGIIDEVGIWNRTLNQTEITLLFNGGAGLPFVPINPALILAVDLIAPANDTDSGTATNQFQANTTIFQGNITNTTLTTWWSNGTIFGTNFTNITGTLNNLTNLSMTFPTRDDFQWNFESCATNSTSAICIFSTENRTINIKSFLETSQTFNASAFETEQQGFSINITTNGTAPTTGKLIYNGTSSTATITAQAGNNYSVNGSTTIPLVAESKPFFFNFTIGGIELSSATQTQTISLTNFTYAISGVPFINISFKNETIAEPLINATIDSDWFYWLGDGSVVKTLTYTNLSENLNYTFLLAGLNRTLNANVSLTYDNSISEQRSFQQSYILTNTTTEQTLFLLPTSDGVFITFQVVTIAEQVIAGVAINVTKSGTIVETGTTDSAGLKTFFLDPDTTYGFSFFKSGFDVFTTSIAPTQTTFTITLGQAAADVINDTTKGISYVINPTTNVLDNNTIVEFNYTITSSFWAFDNFELFLGNSTGNFFNSTASTTSTGGFLSQSFFTGDNTDIIMTITWTINGNQTNITRTWIVRNYFDEGFSIRTFFDDLSIYLTSDMFGLTNFGLGIILFLIIVVTTGILSVKFGITSPAGIAIIVFSMVAFFDVALGIMPNPVNAIPNFPTVFMAIVFLGTFIKEAIIR